jgi:hypothetical protein
MCDPLTENWAQKSDNPIEFNQSCNEIGWNDQGALYFVGPKRKKKKRNKEHASRAAQRNNSELLNGERDMWAKVERRSYYSPSKNGLERWSTHRVGAKPREF